MGQIFECTKNTKQERILNTYLNTKSVKTCIPGQQLSTLLHNIATYPAPLQKEKNTTITKLQRSPKNITLTKEITFVTNHRSQAFLFLSTNKRSSKNC